MALVLKDRVLETSTSTGTGAFALGGAQTGFQSFSVIGSGNTTYYTIQGKNADGTLTGEWEVGTGTYTTGSLARDTVLESSNANSLVVFSAGAKDVFCDLPAEKVLAPSGTSSQLLANDGSGGLSNVTIGSNLTYSAGTLSATGGGGMTYPGAGIANSTGSAWGTSYTTSGSGTVVALSDSPTFTTAITSTGALQLTGSDTVNQNIATAQTTGTLAIGGTGATGAITLGQSTGAQNINIATSAATTSIVNIGGTGTSTGAINIGRSTGSQTISIGSGAAGSTVTTGQTRAINIGSTSFGTGVSNVNIGKYSATVVHNTGIAGNIVTIQAQTLTLNTIGALNVGGNVLQNANVVSGLAGLTGVAVGSRAFVTDASSPQVGSTVVGGGSVAMPVYYDGTNWICDSGLNGTASLNINGTVGATTPNTGAFTYISTNSSTSTTPTLSFNASNSPYAAGATISGSYLQHMLQNKSATANASTNYVLSNDSGTDSTFYGEFGMNSSVFSASTPADYFSINNGVYFSAHDGDITVGSGNGFKTYLAWGTTGQSAHVINASGAIGLNTNLGTTPALSGTTNFGTSGQVLTSAGSAATATWSSTPTLTGTNFTGIPNGGLTNSAITFGATSQALGSTVSALNAVSVGATTASTGRFTGVTVTAGTASIAPILLTSGTNLTSATAGAIEYDGVNFYATAETTSGRNVVPEYQQFYLSSNVTAFGPASGDFFGATSSASLAATTSYDIECYCYFLKSTAGTAQWIPTFSTALTVGHSYLEYTPVTGFTTTLITGAMVVAEATQQTTTVLTHAATASLTTAVSHIAKLKIRVLTNTACNFRLKFVGSAGTITPQAGSWYTVRKVASNAGNFVA